MKSNVLIWILSQVLVFFELKIISRKIVFTCIYYVCKFQHGKHELANLENETYLRNSS